MVLQQIRYLTLSGGYSAKCWWRSGKQEEHPPLCSQQVKTAAAAIAVWSILQQGMHPLMVPLLKLLDIVKHPMF